MKLSTEVIEMVNKASSAINALPPGRGGGVAAEDKRFLIRKLQNEIRAARLKGVTWKALTRSIKESTGISINQSLLKACFIEIEAKAQTGDKATGKEPRRYGTDYNL